MRQRYEDIENSKGVGRHHEEVRRDQLLRVVVQESPPRLGRRFSLTNHVLGHGGLGYFDPELEQFPMDPRRSPERIGQTHLADQLPNLPSIAAFPVRPADSSIANSNGTLFDARRSPFRALRSAARSAMVTRGGRAQPRAVGPRGSDEDDPAATSSGPLAGGGELESQPAGLREIETTIGC